MSGSGDLYNKFSEAYYASQPENSKAKVQIAINQEWNSLKKNKKIIQELVDERIVELHAVARRKKTVTQMSIDSMMSKGLFSDKNTIENTATKMSTQNQAQSSTSSATTPIEPSEASCSSSDSAAKSQLKS